MLGVNDKASVSVCAWSGSAASVRLATADSSRGVRSAGLSTSSKSVTYRHHARWPWLRFVMTGLACRELGRKHSEVGTP